MSKPKRQHSGTGDIPEVAPASNEPTPDTHEPEERGPLVPEAPASDSGNGNGDLAVVLDGLQATAPIVGMASPLAPVRIDPRVTGTLLQQRPTSINLGTARGRALAFNAIAEATLQFADNGTARMIVSDYILHPGEATDEATGEIRSFLWLTLISPDGETFSTTSDVVMKRFGQLLSWCQDFFDGRPIEVMIAEKRSRRSKQVYHQIYAVPPGE